MVLSPSDATCHPTEDDDDVSSRSTAQISEGPFPARKETHTFGVEIAVREDTRLYPIVGSRLESVHCISAWVIHCVGLADERE